MQKYFVYARKSTDVEDKQVLSIEAQLVELRTYARNERLEIVDELIEKKSAKMPGRPVFADMLKRIERGEANGIIAWHPDRLARNSIDGGQIVYLLDQTLLKNLKFPTFWFENTSQGKFMLSIAFGQSKYYVDNLSENTKRGLRQKVRRGEFPGPAPVGYINDIRTKEIVTDKRRAPVVVETFELYAKGESCFEDVSQFLFTHGIKTSGNKQFPKDQVKRLLTNPFYYGHFRYAGEIHEGKHEAIISKKLFDNVQAVIAERSRPRKGKKNDPMPLCGTLHCGTCGMMITGEKRIKRQKNGNVHRYVYYRCSKKNKTLDCHGPHIREELLNEQLLAIIHRYAMPDEWAQRLYALIEQDISSAQATNTVTLSELEQEVSLRAGKLQRLLDSYLDQDIEREVYLAKKAELMSEKKSFEENLSKLTLNKNIWVEPMKRWIETAVSICKIKNGVDVANNKSLLVEIFGSNLILKNKKARLSAPKTAFPPLKNQWTALRAALDLAASRRTCSDLVGDIGFEPITFSTSMRCSSQMS